MNCPKLPIVVHKNFQSKQVVQCWNIDQAELGVGKQFICKANKSHSQEPRQQKINKYKITKQINVNVLKRYLSAVKKNQVLFKSKVRNPKSRLLHLVSQPWLGRLDRHSKASTR